LSQLKLVQLGWLLP